MILFLAYVLDVGKYIRKLDEPQSGFHIKYKVGVSKFGRGIFAQEDITEGTLVWSGVYGRNIRRFINEDEVRLWLSEMPNNKVRKEWLQFPIVFDGGFELDLDDGRFINHSYEPNIGYPSIEDNRGFALRDIKQGEELYENYNNYEPKLSPASILVLSWVVKIYAEYGIDESYREEKET